jgi:tRNA threonylcarbamoyladenosine biosynthesis protein TsaB
MNNLILTLDTTTATCSIAVGNDKILIESTQKILGTETIEQLPELLTKLLDNNDINFNSLNLMAVCVGPGSYTGTRIGISLMQGIQSALGIDLIGIRKDDLIFHNYRNTNDQITVILDAGRGKLWVRNYLSSNTLDFKASEGEIISSLESLTLDESKAIISEVESINFRNFIKLNQSVAEMMLIYIQDKLREDNTFLQTHQSISPIYFTFFSQPKSH